MNSFSLGAWIMIGVVVIEILALIAIIISLSKAGRVVEVHRQPANAYGGQPGGYPAAPQGGYGQVPPQQQPGGHPSAQQPGGYPPAQQGTGYPPAQQPGGYPPPQSPTGFPPAGDTPPSYPPQG